MRSLGKTTHSHGLDNLRTISILLALFWHFLQIEKDNSLLNLILSTGPWGGANPLFLVSGYLLGNQILSRYAQDKKVSLFKFYFRRALKTWPNYFVLIFIVFQIPLFQESEQFPSIWKFLTFTQNFNFSQSALSHTWSLCIEEHFYLVLPLASLLFLQKPKLKKVVLGVTALLFLGFFQRGYLWTEYLKYAQADRFSEYFNKIYYPTYNRLDGLVIGVFIAYLQNYVPELWKKILLHANEWLTLGLVLCLFGWILQIQRTSFISTLLVFPVMAFGFACIMIAAIESNTIISRAAIPWTRKIANLSYALFIVHKPVSHVMRKFLNEYNLSFSLDLILSVLLGFVLSFAVALILYFVIEKPILKLRDRLIPTIDK